MISQAQAVEAARRALSLCVSLLSRSPDSITDNVSLDYYAVVWDSAYLVCVSKQAGVVRRITTIRNRTVAARRQYGPMAQIKSGAGFTSWQKLAAQQFQASRDALPVLSEATNLE